MVVSGMSLLPWRTSAVLVIATTLLMLQQTANAQTSSSYGKEFYIGFMRNFGGSRFTSLRLLIGTTADSANYMVEANEETIQTGMVSSTAGPVIVDISSDLDLQVIDSEFENRRKGIHVFTTTEDATLFVLAENFVSPFNYGVFLAYPCITIETDNIMGYEYYIISSQGSDRVRSQFLLVGCEDFTTITVTPSTTVSLPQDLQMAGATINVEAGATSSELILNKLDTLLVSSADDLTGTKVVSSHPLTVISGHECANIPPDASGCEPLAFQVPPSATWGTKFFLAPFAGRNIPGGLNFKIVSAEDANIVYRCVGSESPQASVVSGVLDFVVNDFCYLESSKPLLVAELSPGGSMDGRGDPAILMLSPIDQYINEITFFSLQKSTFPSNYISVTVSAEHYDSDKILLDGVTLDCEWKEILDTNTEDGEDEGEANIVGYGCNKEVSSNDDTPKQHTVSHMDADGRVSVLVYGFSASPGRGYAYLAGQRIVVTGDDGEEIVIEFESLEFVDLMNFEDAVNELDTQMTGRQDGSSEPIYIPDGLIFGDELVTSAYVNENGVISFKEPWKYFYPERFPTQDFFTRQALAVAPFWSDNDIRVAGFVRYATFCDLEEQPECHETSVTSMEGRAELRRVVDYVQRYVKEGESRFRGKWMLVAHWDHVPPSPHGVDNENPELNKFNNYQAIIVSDVLRTYVVFSYKCGEMEWSALGTNRPAVVGYNAMGKYFYNHPLSGYLAVGNAVSCIFNLGRRRKRQTLTNNMGFQLPAGMEITNQIDKCISAFDSDLRLLFLQPIDNLANMLEPCPCDTTQVNNNLGTFRRQADILEAQCYIVSPIMPPIQLLFSGVEIGLTQQCCYNEYGALQKSSTEGYSGTMLLYHPVDYQELYEDIDKGFREACCEIGVNIFCQKFFKQRKINECEDYLPPAHVSGSGDPHYWTFNTDQGHYDFQGLGDFTLLNAFREDSTTLFTLQARLNRFYGGRSVTWHQGLAFGNSELAFEFFPDGRVFQTKPGPTSTDITSQLLFYQPWNDATGQAQLTKYFFNTLGVVLYHSGVTLTITGYGPGRHMDFGMNVPSSFVGLTRGVFGNFNRTYREFYRKDSNTRLAEGLSNQELYEPFLTWRVSEDESLFVNPTRQKRQTTPEDEYVPIYFEDLDITDEQKMICEDNEQCLFDLAVTGNETIAMNTLDHEKEGNATRQILNNFPPNISAEASFRVTVGVESVFTLFVMDPGDNFTLSVEGGLPENSVLEQVTDEEYAFHWNLQQVTTKVLVFIANDTQGAASVFVPTVEVCACSNGGQCTLDGVLNSNATVIMNCICTEAFDGQFCEEDRNGCSEIQCFEGLECMDVPAPGVGAVCEGCPPGYTGDALKCYDIDECSANDTLCDQICVNTDGSYFCSCMDGYQLKEGTIDCEDINECASVNDCQQICKNTIGSYECSCMDGFTLADDEKGCNANEPCRGECEVGCAVVDGVEQCYCQIGFVLSPPGGTQCVDQDECLTDPCEHTCTNTEGSFDCTCRDGYELQEDGKTCKDVDECFMAASEGLDLCENVTSTECVNNEGSFECVCVPGYILVNDTCEIIEDEPPPPPPPVVILDTSAENSVNFTSPALTPETFTSERKQAFRKIAASAVTNYCSGVMCNLVLSDGKTQGVTDLKVDPTNIAIPTSLITDDIEGQLLFTIYIQLTDGVLAKKDLNSALMEADEELLREAGFLDPLPTTPPPTTMMPTTEAPTTMMPTTEAPTTMMPTTEIPTTEVPKECPPACTVEYCSSFLTRRSLCTIPDPQESECEARCRVTYCHTCYYADEHRPLPGNCQTCPFYPQEERSCFKKWAVCVRRTNGQLYQKARGRKEKAPGRFRCYEHPCNRFGK